MNSTDFTTDQERFWAGGFGDGYTERNSGKALVAANIALFASALQGCTAPRSVLEVGANRGLNIQALQTLFPTAELAGLEINAHAADELEKTGCTVFRGSALNFEPPRRYDLTFTKGVLIHIAPEQLDRVYELLYGASCRYLMVAEYYNPQPEVVTYRGEDDRLFRRDFAGDLMDRYPDLRLVRSGFAYHRDPFPQDDLTWFLLEKST